MNKFLKIIIAILGGINVIFDMFIPIAIALIIVKFYPLDIFSQNILITAGSLSTIYKALKIAILKQEVI